MTYRGHSVLRTLIRCYFSPIHSTSQKFVYTGSSDEHIYVYSLEGDLVVTFDVKVEGEPEFVNTLHNDYYSHYEHTVRDVSWHPYLPLMVNLHF